MSGEDREAAVPGPGSRVPKDGAQGVLRKRFEGERSSIRRFEDLDAWKLARALARDLYRISSEGPLSKDYPLRDQLRRAAVSVVVNIAEGFERGGDREFRQFLSQAKGSVGEVKTCLYLVCDVGHSEDREVGTLMSRCDEVARLIGGLLRYLEGADMKGRKFR